MKHIYTLLFAVVAVAFTPFTFADTNDTVSQSEEVVLYVDINNDSAEKMADLLKGIGLKKAEAIIAYREENGPFLALEDILNVPGIGPSTLEKNRQIMHLGTSDKS